jgi:hypothetical protein
MIRSEFVTWNRQQSQRFVAVGIAEISATLHYFSDKARRGW